MNSLFGRSDAGEDSEWLSVSDLMAGLMVIFLFIAVIFIRPIQEQNERIREIAATWQQNEEEIYLALLKEFRDDLGHWNAELQKETLLIRFKSPDVLFERGKSQLRYRFSGILDDFFPRYAAVLARFRGSIEEVRIEGHTSSIWNRSASADDAYFRNMALSQTRTRAVLRYVLNLEDVAAERPWLQPLVTANGLSSSRPVLNAAGIEDREGSRRVEFRIRTTAKTEIVRILETIR